MVASGIMPAAFRLRPAAAAVSRAACGGALQEKDQYLGGWIAAAFFLAGAPAAVVMGWVSGSHNRCTLVLWVVVFGAHSLSRQQKPWATSKSPDPPF